MVWVGRGPLSFCFYLTVTLLHFPVEIKVLFPDCFPLQLLTEFPSFLWPLDDCLGLSWFCFHVTQFPHQWQLSTKDVFFSFLIFFSDFTTHCVSEVQVHLRPAASDGYNNFQLLCYLAKCFSFLESNCTPKSNFFFSVGVWNHSFHLTVNFLNISVWNCTAWYKC